MMCTKSHIRKNPRDSWQSIAAPPITTYQILSYTLCCAAVPFRSSTVTGGTASIQEVTERLKSWCAMHDRGLARVEWDSAYARQDVVNRLKHSLGGLGISLVEMSLPPGGTAHETVTRLIEKLRS